MRSQGLLRGSLSMRSRGAGVCWAGPGARRSRVPGSVESGERTLIACAVRAFQERAARGCPASARERPRRPGAAGLGRGSRVVPDLRGRVCGRLCGPRPAAPRAPHQVHLLLPRLWRQLQQSLEARRSSVQAHGERPFVCDYEGCGKAFIRDYHLSRHVLIHTGEKPFVCEDNGCNQKFNTKSNLKKHIERKHENPQKQYRCSFEGCTKAFKKHQQLKTHQCQHTGEPLFRCPQEGCGKHFASPSRLKRHGKVHEGYLCQKGCSFVAKTWTELLKHMREAHKEEVTCAVCQKTFKRKDYLKQHMKTHAPERDVYHCLREGCGRTYTTLFNLQSHILSFHEEERPFVCEHAGCGKTFAMKQSLIRHSVVHDPDKKRMKLKVRPRRERRSLASHLSGYLPPKKKPEPDSSEHLGSSPQGQMLPPAASLTLQ